MDGRQSVGGQTTDVIDVNGLSRPIGVTLANTGAGLGDCNVEVGVDKTYMHTYDSHY